MIKSFFYHSISFTNLSPSDQLRQDLRPPYGIHQLRSDPRLKVRRRHVPQAVEVHGRRATKPSLNHWFKRNADVPVLWWIYVNEYNLIMKVWDVEFGMLKNGHFHGEPDD
jgi:hypothetical protein